MTLVVGNRRTWIFLFLRVFLVCPLFAISFAASVRAQTTTYTYKGLPLTCLTPAPPCLTYTITGSFTVAQPLKPNSGVTFIAPLSFSFTNGQTTITNTDTVFNFHGVTNGVYTGGAPTPGPAFLIISTDSVGNITAWNIDMAKLDPDQTTYTELGTFSLPGDAEDVTFQSVLPVASVPPLQEALVDSSPGTWTSSAQLKITTLILIPFTATTGQPYAAAVAATGGTPPYTWFLLGSPPAGLDINPSTGVVSGTPTEPGPDLPLDLEDPGIPPGILGSFIDVEVEDSAGQTAKNTYYLEIFGEPIHQNLSNQEKDQFFYQALQHAGWAATGIALLTLPVCDANPLCVNLAGGLVEGAGKLAISEALSSIDPPDSNFTSLVSPPTVPVDVITAQVGISQTQADAANAFLTNLQEQESLRWAFYISIDRAQGALDASNTEWELKQLQWAKHFALQLAALIDAEKTLRSNLALLIGQSFSVTQQQIGVIQNAVQSGDLPAAVSSMLINSGMSNLDLARMINLLKVEDWSSVPTGFPALLTDANGNSSEQAGSNALRNFVADTNGDLQVTCSDLAVVKKAFGRTVGVSGYDVRADVNADGVVNVIDLSIVAKQLPSGTVCQ